MSSFVSTFEGERQKCSFKVDPRSTIKGDPKGSVASLPPKAFTNGKLPGQLGGGGYLEDPLDSWKMCRPLQAAHDRALYKTPVPELMGHTFFCSVGSI